MNASQPSQNILKSRLQADLKTAMKARDQLVTATLRMTLAAIHNEEIAGKSPKTLSDEQVLAILTKEAKKRAEAAAAFTQGGRVALAGREQAEAKVLERYLPAQLSDSALASLVVDALEEHQLAGLSQLGAAMKIVRPRVAGRANGSRVVAEVRRQLDA